MHVWSRFLTEMKLLNVGLFSKENLYDSKFLKKISLRGSLIQGAPGIFTYRS